MDCNDVALLWTVIKIDIDHPEADDIIEPTEGELLTQEEFIRFSGNPFGDN
ncbi:hypothetical protein VDP25_08645 [Winogradskyella sp. ECml5-4]|uniref:hypothetical protein n=1 Tax=Winogradskyella sp. ECml5-4 TaxID=3110975 RepID=UPI002FEECC73